MSTYKGRWYIGVPHDRDDIAFAFQSLHIPTTQSHGHLYTFSYGPFRTLRAALAKGPWVGRFIHRLRPDPQP